jgi:predicted nucleic acid-binding Zn ribbon protein
MKRAGDLLKEFFDNIKIKDTGTDTIFTSWEKIAGTDIASHSRIKDYKKNILTIEADHPGWIQIINLKKNQIIQRISEKFPDKEIDEIMVVLRKTKKS